MNLILKFSPIDFGFVVYRHHIQLDEYIRRCVCVNILSNFLCELCNFVVPYVKIFVKMYREF